jgi:arylsulfatase A-like enzyme
MNRRAFLEESLSSGMSIASLKQQSSGGTEPTKPNIILILTDDQGWWEAGAYGNRVIETPVMDRLATEGVRLNSFYVSPLCTPTRSSLLTGRHYQRTGAFDTDMGYDALRSEELTIANVLQTAGYRTGIIGKWHLGRYMKYHPNSKGFQDFFGFWQDGIIRRWSDPEDELYFDKQPFGATGLHYRYSD